MTPGACQCFWRGKDMVIGMKRDEFLAGFHDALIGKVPDSVIQDNLNYYRNYINSQISSGRSEEEVLNMLGDPRLLAKTVEESSKYAGDSNGYSRSAGFDGAEGYYSGNGGFGNFSGFGRDEYDNNIYSQDDTGRHPKTVQFQGWLVVAIIAVILILILMLVFKVAVALAPVILVGLCVTIVARGIRDWLGH